MFLNIKYYMANIRFIKSLTKIDQFHFRAVIGLQCHFAAKIQKKSISGTSFFVFIFIFLHGAGKALFPPFLLGQKILRSQGVKE